MLYTNFRGMDYDENMGLGTLIEPALIFLSFACLSCCVMRVETAGPHYYYLFERYPDVRYVIVNY